MVGVARMRSTEISTLSQFHVERGSTDLSTFDDDCRIHLRT